jgi:hypothetical protein
VTDDIVACHRAARDIEFATGSPATSAVRIAWT